MFERVVVACVALAWCAGVGLGQGAWVETQVSEPSDATSVGHYGRSVVMDGGWVVCHGEVNDDRVIFFRKNGPGDWVETQGVSVAGVGNVRKLAVSGAVVVGGAPFAGPAQRGAAVVLERGEDDVWRRTAFLNPDDLLDNAEFGTFVAASGDRVAVLAHFTFSSEAREAIYVYRRDAGGGWSLEDRIPLFDVDDPSDQRFFPLGLAMDGGTITLLEGGGFKGFCGFRFEAYDVDGQGSWSMRTRIEFEDNCSQYGLAMRGGVAVMGDSALRNGSGAVTGGVRVFRRQASGSWIAGEVLIPADAVGGSLFGGSIAFDGRTVAIGSTGVAGNAFAAFEAQPDGTFADIGVQTSDLFGPTPDVGFGNSLGVDGDDLVAGVPAAGNAHPELFESGALAFFERAGLVDSDGDGLADDWEEHGVPFVAADGSQRRYALAGADPLRKDMFLEVDAALIEMPANAMDMVVGAFARAPVTNPDGSAGITLHILIDERDVPTPGAVVVGDDFPNNFATLRDERFGTVEERADPDAAALLGAKARAFRWCFAYSGIDFTAGLKYFGRADLPGSNFLIDLDQDLFDVVLHPATAPQDIASTFMHEFGHTLGLRHGGADDIQGKPNYPSIMNYALAHTYPWNRGFRRLDFSRERLATLDEGSLRERDGVSSVFYRRFQMPFGRGPGVARGFGFVKLTGRPTDYDGDGSRTGVVAEDLNFLTALDFAGVGFPSPGQELVGHDDWANILYAPVVARGGAQSSGCVNQELYEAMTTMIPTPCEADFDDNGVLDFFDVSAYLVAFNAGDDEADLSEPFGIFDAGDVLGFVSQFVGGCP